SAGSISVSALVLSPLAKGLFARAILESGAQLQNRKEIHTKAKALAEAKEMGKHFKCTDDKTWLDCLRKVDANEIFGYTQLTVGPLVGTAYMPLTAQEAFKDGKYNTDVDLIAGVVRNEGSLLAPKIKGNITEEVFINAIKGRIGDMDLGQVLAYYLKDVKKDDYAAYRWAYYDLIGDSGIKCSTYLFAKQVAQHSTTRNVYFYELTYGHLQGCDEQTMGICHGSDIEFVFNKTHSNPQLDLPFSKEWMTYWTNFAKTGVPTTDAKWPKLVNKAEEYQISRFKDMNP
ncbi:unnamed protein product, partial [Oppiella nova]